MACRTLKDAIAEEVTRYVSVCKAQLRGCRCSKCKARNIRLAHIRYRTIVRLRRLV